MRTIIIIGLVLVFTGCAKIKGLGFDYTRVGDQNIEGFEYRQTLPDGTVNEMSFSKQKGGEAFAEAVKALADKIPTPPIVP